MITEKVLAKALAGGVGVLHALRMRCAMLLPRLLTFKKSQAREVTWRGAGSLRGLAHLDIGAATHLLGPVQISLIKLAIPKEFAHHFALL